MRILVVDDHAAVRRSLARVLRHEPDLEVVGEAPDGDSAVRLAADLEPDVVVMDVAMPEVNGIEATRRILERRPQTCIIGLSVHSSRNYAAQMLRAGARAYVLKDGGLEELVRALQIVHQGRIYLSREIDAFD